MLQYAEEDYLKMIVKKWIPDVYTVEPMTSGLSAQSFLVHSRDGLYVLAAYTNKNIKMIELLVDIQYYVSQAGFPTSTMLLNIEGSYYYTSRRTIQLPTTIFVLRKYLDGTVLSSQHMNPDIANKIGKTLGRFHKASMPIGLFPKKYRRLPTDWEKANLPQNLSQWIQSGQNIPDELANLPTVPCHGDLFLDNIIMYNDEICFIDWEWANTDYAIFDVGMALLGCCLTVDDSLAENFLEGYNQERPLSEHEKTLLPYAVEYMAMVIAYGRWQKSTKIKTLSDNRKWEEMLQFSPAHVSDILTRNYHNKSSLRLR